MYKGVLWISVCCFYLSIGKQTMWGSSWVIVFKKCSKYLAGGSVAQEERGSGFRLRHWKTNSKTTKLIQVYIDEETKYNSSWYYFLLCFASFFQRVLLYSSGRPGTHYAALTGFKLMILLRQPPHSWDYTRTPPHLATVLFWDTTISWISSFFVFAISFQLPSQTALYPCPKVVSRVHS